MASFYEELFKELSSENEIISDNICLITNEPLLDDFITLECKHKFNYKAIFQEISRQKFKEFKYEINRVGKNQLKCPYCRNIQNTLLPPSKEYLETKNPELLVYSVNSPLKWCMTTHNCKYIFKSGKNKGKPCNKKCFSEYCTNHQNIMLKREQNNNNTNKVKTDKHMCCAIISSGKRKGDICGLTGKYLYENKYYCGRHKPKQS
tara:strand:+ start:1107 stop:1721 length:615 start_codon:yes stop_codon:yes gene_type:complete